MKAPDLGIVVIAAGKGTRMRSALPKELHPLCGRPMLGHVLALADALEAAYTVVVLSDEKLGPARAQFGPRYAYAVQHEQLGTGHAVLQARPALPRPADDVLVLYGDTPLLRPSTARAAVELRRRSGALVGILSMYVAPPSGYGRIVRDASGQVVAIVEERNATPEQFAISECNSGVMCFDAEWLWPALDRIAPNPLKGEYYLTDLAEMAVAERGTGAAVALPAADPAEAQGINDQAQLAQAGAVLRQRILNDLMLAGVTVIDPAATYVDVGVSVGRGTTLWPGTLLRGSTSVGAGCEIGPYATIVDSEIGDGARVRHALIERATVAAGAEVGPFVHLTDS
ncbi:MAG TPA: NTP transferase domain-containing protein [Kouleothrix sp.]|uniref:bifunctional UDP-N-acetylglucosamine diphosphorylase/glucosamine-1-phosphate N-acetyltransferase GlmU n=1 Tax=Kouleothrix sp. TaxID=2779161 RepID=UPI002C86A13E|nr:NTP transferase domain-containing protein [Kouleothrix sp.]